MQLLQGRRPVQGFGRIQLAQPILQVRLRRFVAGSELPVRRGETECRISDKMRFQIRQPLLPCSHADSGGKDAHEFVFILVLKHIDGISLNHNAFSSVEQMMPGHISFFIEGAVVAGVQDKHPGSRTQIRYPVEPEIVQCIFQRIPDSVPDIETVGKEPQPGPVVVLGLLEERLLVFGAAIPAVILSEHAPDSRKILPQVVGTSGGGDVLCVRGPVFAEFHQVIAAVLHLLEQPEHYVPAVAVVEELVRG